MQMLKYYLWFFLVLELSLTSPVIRLAFFMVFNCSLKKLSEGKHFGTVRKTVNM